jgi:hypothetical protein
MHKSRRTFLAAVFGAAATSTLIAAVPQMLPAQDVAPPFPGQVPRRPAPEPEPKRDPREELKANQQQIKKDVDRLSTLVADLKKGLDENDTKEVLAIDVVRKATEIEKLAKQIRDLIRG